MILRCDKFDQSRLAGLAEVWEGGLKKELPDHMTVFSIIMISKTNMGMKISIILNVIAKGIELPSIRTIKEVLMGTFEPGLLWVAPNQPLVTRKIHGNKTKSSSSLSHQPGFWTSASTSNKKVMMTFKHYRRLSSWGCQEYAGISDDRFKIKGKWCL